MVSYNQDLIDVIGEYKISQLIQNGIFDSIAYDSLEESDIHMRCAVENYILKYINDPSKRQESTNMKSFVSKVGKGFAIDQTLKFADSIFLNEQNISVLYSDQQREAIRNAKKNLQKTSQKLYKESLTRELNDNEKNILMKYFNKTIKTNNEGLREAQRAYAEKLLEKNVIPTNPEELKFILNYAQVFTLRQEHKIDAYSELFISNMNPSLGGYYNKLSQIFINQNIDKNWKNDLSSLIQVTCHETQHAIQDFEAKHNPKSVTAYEYAVFSLFNTYLTNSSYNPYKAGENYRFQEIEHDAENKGFQNASLFYLSYYDNEKLKKICRNLRTTSRMEERKRGYQYEYVTEADDSIIPKETYNMKHLNEIIRNHPDRLNDFPVLNNLYNKDGSPKSFAELITTDVQANESQYYEIMEDALIYQMRINKGLDNLDLEQFSKKDQVAILKRAISLFYKETDVVTEIVSPQENVKVLKNVIYKTGLYHIGNTQRLSTFIIKNYDFIQQFDEEKLFGGVFDKGRFKNDLKTLINYMEKCDTIPPLKNVAAQNIVPLKEKMEKVKEMDQLLSLKKKVLNTGAAKSQNINISPYKKNADQTLIQRMENMSLTELEEFSKTGKITSIGGSVNMGYGSKK